MAAVPGALAAPPVVPPAEPQPGAATNTPPRDAQTDGGSAAAASPAADPAADPTADPAPGKRSRRLSLLPVALLALVAVLLAAGTVFLALEVREQAQAAQARQEALAASRDAARALFSYDHSSLDQDFARGLAVTTGDFRNEYTRTTSEVVRDVATQYDVVVRADVREAGVVRAAPDEVTVLVLLNQSTTSTRVEGEKIDQSRVRMRLVKEDGRWLVAEVQAL